MALARSRSSRQESWLGEQDVDVAAAAGRHVGEHLAAAPGHVADKRLTLSADLGRGVTITLMVVPDSSVINIVVDAGRVEIERQHPPGARTRVVNRHCGGLARRVSRQRPRVPRGISAAAVTGNPDVRSSRDHSRDGMPGRLRACP